MSFPDDTFYYTCYNNNNTNTSNDNNKNTKSIKNDFLLFQFYFPTKKNVKIIIFIFMFLFVEIKQESFFSICLLKVKMEFIVKLTEIDHKI